MRFPIVYFLLLAILCGSCTKDRPDPARALPARSGLSLVWPNGELPTTTGFAALDGEIDRLRTLLPTRDTLDPTFAFAAFAYNLRPGELAAGIAVATAGIEPPENKERENKYRDVALYRLASPDWLYAEYRGLSLLGREAVVLQEMIDALQDGTSSVPAGVHRSRLQLNFATLGALLSTQATPAGKDRLAQWARQWTSVRIETVRDSLTGIWLQPAGGQEVTAVDEVCLATIPGGISQFLVLPTPSVMTQRTSGNWGTYFAPWLGSSYVRITAAEGEAIAFCPRDADLMQDLIDRLAGDFPVADRIVYPNGTIWKTAAPGLTAYLSDGGTAATTWVLRTAAATYLAADAAVLEKLLDLQLLSGSTLLLSQAGATRPRPGLVAQLSRVRWAEQLAEALPQWSPPPWTRGLEGQWTGQAGPTPIELSPVADSAAAPAATVRTSVPPVSVAWRWEAPAEVARILPIPGQPACAVYLQDGSLIVLADRQEVRMRTRLGTFPNSPVYYLPASKELPERWLFSTPSAVFLIDAAGEALPGFPYRPVGGLAAGVLLDDLDKANNPAYFLPLRSGRIEAYSLRGLPMVNWQVPTGFPVVAPLVSLHSDTSTYVAGLDSLFRVRVYDRRGEIHLAFDSLPSPFISPLQGQLTAGAGVGRLAALELDGRIRVMSMGGGQFPLRVTTAAGPPRQFVFDRVWGDIRKDYLVGRDDAVALYAYAKNDFAQRWQSRFPASVERIFTLPSLQLVGGLDVNRGLIYLLRGADGTPVEENGLAGRVPGLEWITPGGETLLVTAYRNTVYAYRIEAGT